MIRQMTAGDLDGIAHIEKSCFGEPWSRELLVPLIDSRLDSCFVLEENGTILGYGVLRILAGEGEIMRIAVLSESRGRGFGRKLMDAMVGFAREQEVSAMTLEVRESNETAINLYRAYGFASEAVRKDYYHNPKENAILMWKHGV